MRIRKIEEIILTEGVITRTQQYHLIIDEKEEGWELSTEELIQVKQIIEEALKLTAYISADFSKVLDFTAIELVKDDHSDECPNYIEPQDDHLADEATRFLPKEVTASSPGVIAAEEKLIENAKARYSMYSPYIEMLNSGSKVGEIIKQMATDLEISEGTAQNYFYRSVKPFKTADAIPAPVEDKVADKGQVERAETSKSLAKKIAKMPAYQTAREFVDATIQQDIGQNKEVWELKAMYLQSHPHIKWR